MAIIHLNEDGFKRRVHNFEENPDTWKFLGQRPAIIDFYADWCGPCKSLAPMLEELANEYEGKIDVYKVNVDDEGKLAELFGVQSIPTLIFVPLDGTPQKSVGLPPRATLHEVAASLIKH